MSIKRYVADKDTTITDAYLEDLLKNAKNANMGAADSLELFSIYGQANASSIEKSRILIHFPVDKILSDRNKSLLPSSGSVKFFLRVFNVEHPYSVPREFTLDVMAVSQSWDEGYGLDMESYQDLGFNSGSIQGYGATWKYRHSGSLWSANGISTEGGSFLTQSQYKFVQDFSTGIEDIELDITNLIEDWSSGIIENNGLVIKLSGSYEDGSLKKSFYTKKFSARDSEFFFKRPVIEARWESITNDDRNNFYASSSMLSSEDNKMNLFFYNKVNGNKKNIVNNILPGIKFYSDSSYLNEVSAAYSQITNPLAGVYKAVVSINTTASVLYDKWYNTSSLSAYFSSSFDVLSRQNFAYDTSDEYVYKILNNKYSYNNNEIARINIFSRKKDWQPTVYTVSKNNIENEILTDLYYKIFRLNDNYVVLDYSTGSLSYTKTSYDLNGNYFDLDMSILQNGYNYGIRLARWNGVELNELPITFKFKVE